jgi:hypothetical protein
MNLFCKLFGHDYNFQVQGFMYCVRCWSKKDFRWVHEINRTPRTGVTE